MAGLRRRPTPEERAKLAPYLEGLVRRLFEGGDQVFFERPQASPEGLEDFLSNEAVLEETFDYVERLMTLWQAGQYGKSLRVMARKQAAKPIVERAVMPELHGDEPLQSSDAEGAPTEAASPPVPETEASAMPNSKTDPLEQPPASPGEIRPGEIPAASRAPARPAAPQVSFHLPNAKVGLDYAEPIEGRGPGGEPVRILDAKIPAGLGLSFDRDTQELRGTPLLDGDHRFQVLWTLDGAAKYSGDCLLIVNPDPKSLWKVIEPPPDAPYPKSHREAELLELDGLRIAAASRRGRSHEHAGSFRDDDFAICHDRDSGWSLMLVADGAGSATFSREGSRIAVATAGEHLLESLKGDFGARMTAALDAWDADPAGNGQTMGKEFHYLFHKSGQLAVKAIEQEAQDRGAQVRDYATTLLAAAVKRQGESTFLASFWMGDGAIAAYGPRGKVRLMGTPDGGEFAGQTRFLDRAALSDQGFAKRIGIGRYQDLSAVLLMTDGVSDPRFETDNGLSDPAKWDLLWDELAPLLESPEPAERLADWLEFFSPGHHDDRTLALLW